MAPLTMRTAHDRAEKTHAVRYDSLDGLRGLAACAVMAFHFGSRLPGEPVHFGLLGVELFFVISGFVILLTLEQRRSIGHFVIARAARLYPAYWVAVVLAALLYLPAGEVGWMRVAANLTMLQTYIGVANLETSYWTLALELWFYVLMAGVCALRLIPRLEVLCAAWLAALTLWHLATPASLVIAPHLTLVHFGHLFIAGMMIYRLQHGGGRAAAAVLMAALAYSLFGRHDWTEVDATLYAPCCAIFVLLVWDATSGDRLRWVLSSKPLRFLGGISYCLYLVHMTVVEAFVRATGSEGWGVALATPATVLAAMAMRQWVEIPGGRLIRSLAD